MQHRSHAGRPRDSSIDVAVLQAAQDQLAQRGYDAFSVAAVAEAAGTSRQAVYRRWSGKADLATAAIASMSRAADRPDTEDPHADLIAELAAFADGVTRPGGVALVGAMLQLEGGELLDLYRSRIVTPRRDRLRHILGRAVELGLLDASGDLEHAAATCTGSLYGQRLAGTPVDEHWPTRTATLIWRGLGGSV
ncbi:TetR/AcrR family transcriptional regulator [Euzebya tangerina]|uniref:TetR/AcrR family transcriptional regulator n=1 Tax=Euzebya tangerina TaxID=591198 RepID=UPI000E31720C|nr:TetR/AcrR family transcriptional regulator [Euzebya tangerina]